MTYKFSSDKPIFLQLSELLKSEIVSGKIKPGEKLKSVRDYSAVFKVNPNTVQKALSELEAEGLIYTDRTNGKFVSKDSKLVETSRVQEATEKVKAFFDNMQSLGFDKRDIVKIINKMEDNHE